MAEEVVLHIQWTPAATNSFSKIVTYLQYKWSEKEVEQFVARIEKMILTLKSHPEMCRPSSKRKYVRIGILDKHTQLVYYYKPGTQSLIVLLLWNMKQNPTKFGY